MASYFPAVFDVRSMDEAKSIILTPEPETTTEERWLKETPYVVDRIAALTGLTQASLVLDYGCGIGRIAKGLIERTGCSVIGVDLSLSMRQLAPAYVNSDRFSVVTPEVFDGLLSKGLEVDCAFSVWVLQHCSDPLRDIDRIARAVSPGGHIYLLNNIRRCVPTDQGWFDDGLDIDAVMSRTFIRQEKGQIPEGVATDLLRLHSFWGWYRRQ